MLKFIHTSDWHLGHNLYGYDRSQEQKAFLQQMVDIVRKHQPDALLVSGDIFHTAAPSNATVSLYVNAMLDIHKACTSMAIIVIAGNHDSASRLESDKRLWEIAGVNVLGGIARNLDGQANLERHIIKVGGKGIVAAVPFAYPAGFPQVNDGHADRDQRQPAYFQALLDQASAVNTEGVPVVLMAHLAVNNSDLTGHDNNIMDCVEMANLGQGYDYAALGHIHRPQNPDSHIRYCGTPIAVSFDEQCEHSVSIVEIEAHGCMPRIETKAIKNPRPLHTIPASDPVDFDTLMSLLQEAKLEEHSYIRLNVLIDNGLPIDANERVAKVLADKGCYYCEMKKTRRNAIGQAHRQMTADQLSEISPLEVAKRHYNDTLMQEMSPEEIELFNEAYRLVMEDRSK